jgi:hypothetical protein
MMKNIVYVQYMIRGHEIVQVKVFGSMQKAIHDAGWRILETYGAKYVVEDIYKYYKRVSMGRSGIEDTYYDIQETTVI